MASVFTYIVGGTLFLLSGIHLYWLGGGRRGVQAAVPSDGSEVKLRPPKIATGIVAVALALAGLFVLELGEVMERLISPEWLFLYGGWVLSGVFILRSVGIFAGLASLRNGKEPYLPNGTQCCIPRCVSSSGYV